MKRFALVALLNVLCTVAYSQALPNLILAGDDTCDGKTSCGGWKYTTPSNERVYLVNGTTWKLGSKILPSETLQQCTIAIIPEVYSSCMENGVRMLVAARKETLAWPGVEPPAPTTTRIKYTWKAPTLDANGQALPAGEIVGYQFTWWPDGATGDTTVLDLGNVLEFTLTAPRKKICAALTVEGKAAFSDSTPTLCVDPTVPAPVKITPGPALDFTGAVLPD